MKRLSSLILVAVFVFFSAFQAFAGNEDQTIKGLVGQDAANQGVSHGKEFTVQGGASTQMLAPVVVSDKVIAEAKKATAKEIAEAKSRDYDQLVWRFFSEPKAEVCDWYSLDEQLLEWLRMNKDYVVDFKDYDSSYKVTRVSKHDGSVTSVCTTMLTVHYSIAEE